MTKEEVLALLENVTPEDFDGHTDFSYFSAEKKIEWLSQAAQFYFETNGNPAGPLRQKTLKNAKASFASQ